MHPFSIENITSPPRTMPSAGHDEYIDFTTDNVPGSMAGSAHGATTVSPRGPSTSPDSGIASPPFADVEPRASNVAPRDESARRSPVATPSSEKPTHSYIALISLAILAAPDRRLVLSDIYQYVMTHFPYYDNEERAWRNSIRHNLSLNECFVKVGRAENGKGNYWAVHPACIDDFSKGDYRRRQARRRARANGSDVNVSALPLAYRCNMGYVPMTPHPAGIGYHPYASPYFAAPMNDFNVAGSPMSANVACLHGAANMTSPSYPDQFKTMLQSPQPSSLGVSVTMPPSPASPACVTMPSSLASPACMTMPSTVASPSCMTMPNTFLQTTMPLMTSYPIMSTSPTTPTYFSGSVNASVRYSPYSVSNSWSL